MVTLTGAAQVRVRAALVSVGASLALLALKFGAYRLTGSAAILSDAAESVMNVIAANVALLSLVVAARPADAGHRYGHGKAEYVSSATEGALILLTGVIVVANGIGRLVRPAPLAALPLGVALLLVAAGANALVARFLLRISREHDSAALAADAHHLLADVLTSLGVVCGLGLQGLLGVVWIDPVIGVLVGAHVVRLGAGVFRRAIEGLMDSPLPSEEEARIHVILGDHADEIVEYHALRTRKAGQQRFIDLHLVLHRTLTVGRAHRLCDHLEEHIREALPGTDITIHVEPCGPACERCGVGEAAMAAMDAREAGTG